MTQTIDDTLNERGTRYGEFTDHAEITQAIKSAMVIGRNWNSLPDDMKEALEMIAHKAGRILNGDPDYIDSWTDIIGYTRLVEKRLIADQAEPKLESMADMLIKSLNEINRVSIGEKLADVKLAPSKPSDAEVSAALELLLAAGVLTVVDGDA